MTPRRVALAAALLLAAACTSPEDEEDLYLPTEAEARAKADATINEQNADEELEKLQEELEAGQR
ncbi:MAG TPA: hypothetical protein VFD43_02630 [Planctomycetota bacterium]|nr:hypothetical protein [Planctomycetota bacterium]